MTRANIVATNVTGIRAVKNTPAQKLTLERGLLGLSALFLFVNTLSLNIIRAERADWSTFVVWLACTLGGYLFLNIRLPHRDPLLYPLVMFMSGWGILLIDRLAPNFGERQTFWLIPCIVVMIIFAWFPRLTQWMRTYRYTLLFSGLALLTLTIILGTNPSDPEGIYNAPQLWLGFGSVFIQPSEVLKVALVVFLASYLAEQYPALRAENLVTATPVNPNRRLSLSPRILGPILLMWGISIVVLIWQRDLGTAILFFMVFLTLLYVASGYTRMLIIGALLVILAGFAAYYLFGVVRLRIDIWIDPWADPQGRAYQIVQSLMAFAAGGIFGQGIGQGAPLLIPVAHSDFVFAALAEEWGLLGVTAVIIAEMIFVSRGLRIAISQNGKPFHTLLAVGLSSVIAIQTLLIMGGVLKLIPLTGVTLPFFSYGGSSLVVSFAITGLLLRLSAGEN